MPASKNLVVQLKKSTNRRTRSHRACVRGLGLKKIGQTVVVADTPANRGMIDKVSYLLSVQEESS